MIFFVILPYGTAPSLARPVVVTSEDAVSRRRWRSIMRLVGKGNAPGVGERTEAETGAGRGEECVLLLVCPPLAVFQRPPCPQSQGSKRPRRAKARWSTEGNGRGCCWVWTGEGKAHEAKVVSMYPSGGYRAGGGLAGTLMKASRHAATFLGLFYSRSVSRRERERERAGEMLCLLGFPSVVIRGELNGKAGEDDAT